MIFRSGEPVMHLHPSLPVIAFHPTSVCSGIHVLAQLLTHIQASHRHQCAEISHYDALMTRVVPIKLWKM